MSVEEILASIDALPKEQRQIVYDAVADRHRMEETQRQETPEEVERIRALIDEGIAAADRGELVEWDYDDFILHARQRHAEGKI